MASVTDNIISMVDLIATLKREYKNRLTEGTILRVVEINIAIQQQNPAMPVPPNEGDTDIPLPDGSEPFPEEAAVEAAVTAEPTKEDA